MLKKLAFGLAGAAAATVAGSTLAPSAEADVFNFNGSNTATVTTTITNASGQVALPLLKLSNSSAQANPSFPADQQPGALYAQATNYTAIYANTTGTGTSPSAIIGFAGSEAPVSDPFFANSNAGIVGTSTPSRGVAGLSLNNVGVDGLSFTTFGVRGVSKNGVGGGFASNASDPNVGAALRLGLRTQANGTPVTQPPVSSGHDAGELYADTLGRVWMCVAGSQSTVINAAPTTNATIGGTGVVNPNGSNWRLMAPMIIRQGAPETLTPFSKDNELHVQGELWLDSNSGKVYTCVQSGSTNTTMLANASLPQQPPIFRALSGTSTQLLQQPGRFIDTRGGVQQVNDTQGPYLNGTVRTYTITSLTASNGVTIPSSAIGILGNVTVTQNIASGFGVVYPAGNASSVSTINFNQYIDTANSFTCALNANGQFSVGIYLYSAGQTHVIIDIVGYLI